MEPPRRFRPCGLYAPAAGREVWNRARFPCRAFSLQTLPLGHGCWFPIPSLTASGLSSPSQVCGLSPLLSPCLRFSAGLGDALYRATRCGVIFLYSIDYISATFVLTMRLRFCNLHTWTTGKAGNTAPRGQVPTPTRRTYRLSGREALSNRGVGAKEAPPQARTRLTRAGIQTAGKTAGTGRSGTAGGSSRVTSVAAAGGGD